MDRVNNASKACGPLCAWVISQVHYSSILDKVQPLRDEVVRLEEEMKALEGQQQVSSNMIKTLEASIDQYKKVRGVGTNRLQPALRPSILQLLLRACPSCEGTTQAGEMSPCCPPGVPVPLVCVS